jgi:hypothetical protein
MFDNFDVYVGDRVRDQVWQNEGSTPKVLFILNIVENQSIIKKPVRIVVCVGGIFSFRHQPEISLIPLEETRKYSFQGLKTCTIIKFGRPHFSIPCHIS